MNKTNSTHIQTCPKQISFGRLAYESLPEMWSFQFLAAILLAIPSTILTSLINFVADTSGHALTTANFRDFLLSWRAPVILILGFLMVFFYVLLEILVQVYLCADILNGRPVTLRHALSRGISLMKKFLNISGIRILVYVFIAVPLCGIGFSISLTSSLRVPGFILNTILRNPFLAVGYFIGIAALVRLGYYYIFSIHGILLDGMAPKAAKKHSRAILKGHHKKFILKMIKLLLIVAGIQGASWLILTYLPTIGLERAGLDLPKGYVLDILSFTDPSSLSELDGRVLRYRVICCIAVLMVSYLKAIISLLTGAYFMLHFTRYYYELSGTRQKTWTERPRKEKYRRRIYGMIGVFVILAAAGIIMGLFYQQIFVRETPVKIIAHRAGGNLASENSLEGIDGAVTYGCYGAEVDVQRTQDGFYIINHDSTFKRLTGVKKSSSQMTLEEIRELRITDTTGNGNLLPVVTLEEMLDACKGRIKLFIELKGSTADTQMADDIVRIVREKDMVDEVALISLNYKVIDYAETNYPEFETGAVFFAGVGNVAKLNCDLMFMEEETASKMHVFQVHQAGKTAIVWTVNSASSMYRFLNSDIDAIITDEIRMTEKVFSQLAQRSDLKVIQDKLSELFA